MQRFHGSDKNKICVFVGTTVYILYNIGDSAYELNSLIFVLKTDLTQCKDKVKFMLII